MLLNVNFPTLTNLVYIILVMLPGFKLLPAVWSTMERMLTTRESVIMQTKLGRN
jgi:hypothetical protein